MYIEDEDMLWRPTTFCSRQQLTLLATANLYASQRRRHALQLSDCSASLWWKQLITLTICPWTYVYTLMCRCRVLIACSRSRITGQNLILPIVNESSTYMSDWYQLVHRSVNANLGLLVFVLQVFQFDPSEHALLVEDIKQCKVWLSGTERFYWLLIGVILYSSFALFFLTMHKAIGTLNYLLSRVLFWNKDIFVV